MKRFLSLLLTVVLVLSAMTALADALFETAYYTLNLPEGWDIDQDNLEEQSNETMEVLGYFYSTEEIGLVVSAYLAVNGDAQESLADADDATIQEFVDVLMEDFTDNQAEYLGIIQAGSIPFVLIRGTDQYGEFLYAETLINSGSVEFEAYVLDAAETQYPLTDEAIEQFKSILATFQPAA